jgi:hypothetical protein
MIGTRNLDLFAFTRLVIHCTPRVARKLRTAIDGNARARDPARPVGCDKCDSIGDILGFADPRKNVETFLKNGLLNKEEQQGCFSVNSMREFAILPDEAYGVVTENRALLERLLVMNIEAENTKMSPSAIAEMVLSFFSGLCIERNLKSGKASSTRKIETFMTALRNL